MSNTFILLNAIVWAVVGTVTYMRRQKTLQTMPKSAVVQASFAQANTMRPFLPWMAFAFVLTSVTQFASSQFSGIFGGIGAASAGLLCLEMYITLVQNSRSTWKASTLKTALWLIFFIGAIGGLAGYIVTSGSY